MIKYPEEIKTDHINRQMRRCVCWTPISSPPGRDVKNILFLLVTGEFMFWTGGIEKLEDVENWALGWIDLASLKVSPS